jgi:hypothetical protein
MNLTPYPPIVMAGHDPAIRAAPVEGQLNLSPRILQSSWPGEGPGHMWPGLTRPSEQLLRRVK